MRKVLFVEDSEEFHKLVQRTLSGYQVTCVTTVDLAMEALSRQSYDLMLLDISLPNKNGYTLLSELQSQKNGANIPVICLTSRSEVTDKVTAFSLGAEDYIVKPFDPLELRARVEVKLRKRKEAEESTSYFIGNLEIDTSSHRVLVEEKGKKVEVSLTQMEFKLLCCLTKKTNWVFSRDQLLVAAWGKMRRSMIESSTCTFAVCVRN